MQKQIRLNVVTLQLDPTGKTQLFQVGRWCVTVMSLTVTLGRSNLLSQMQRSCT